MNQIYVHYDAVSSHILAQGIVFSVIEERKIAIPKNILLLKGQSPLAVYDEFTGFYYIKGEEKVQQYLAQMDRQLHNWIDFESMEFLHQLSPQEVADLLYLSHAHSHLHSPFFYKMQNNYVYLTLENQFTKVYYRYIDQFLVQLAQAIQKRLELELNHRTRKWWFSHPFEVGMLDETVLKPLFPHLREGVLWSLDNMVKADDGYRIPIYIAEDKVNYSKAFFTEKNVIGSIRYDEVANTWELLIEE